MLGHEIQYNTLCESSPFHSEFLINWPRESEAEGLALDESNGSEPYIELKFQI